MSKEKQKMTLNVRRRSALSETPPAVDPSQIEAFAAGAENAKQPAAKPEKTPKMKVVRDAFTMRAEDHQLFAEIQSRCLKVGINVTKSEIVRAGLNYLAELDVSDLKKIVMGIPKIKSGRPVAKKD